MLFAIFVHLLNSKNYDPVFLFKTIFCQRNCFLSSVATEGKHAHGSKLENVEPTSLNFNVLTA